jgi:hypothetical protein
VSANLEHTVQRDAAAQDYIIQGWSDITGTSVCYIWLARDISMSLAYIGMLGREVAVLVSLFSIHMSKLYKQTKWPV